MKVLNYCIDIGESRFGIPYNTAQIDLYNFGVSVSDGIISGTQAISSDGTNISGVLINPRMGRYKFSNIPKGKYQVVVSGAGIRTGILDFDINVYPYDISGSEIAYKDNSSTSVATAIDSLITRVTALEI